MAAGLTWPLYAYIIVQLIPSPPTDNLYKFLAIAGVVGFFYFIALLVRDYEQTRTASVGQAQSTLGLGLEFEELQDEVLAFIDVLERGQRLPHEKELLEKVEDNLKNTSFYVGTSTPNRRAPTELAIAIESMAHFVTLKDDERAIVQQMRRTYYDLLAHSYEIGAMSVAETLRSKAMSPVRITIYILVLASLSCAVVGFWLWYIRVQQFQDLLLRKDIEKPNEPEDAESVPQPNGV